MNPDQLRQLNITNINTKSAADALSALHIDPRPFLEFATLINDLGRVAVFAQAASAIFDQFSALFTDDASTHSYRTPDLWLSIPPADREPALRHYTAILNRGRPRKLSWRRLNRPQRNAAAYAWLMKE